jgi:hypothetical protein
MSFTQKNITNASKTLESVVISIKNFIACFEGRPIMDSATSSNEKLLHIDKKFRMQRPDYKAGDLVHVAPRLWPGINKPGGTAWIQAVTEQADTGNSDSSEGGLCYDCKYVLGGGVDYLVPAAYIRVANDLGEERESRSRRSKSSAATSKTKTNEEARARQYKDRDRVNNRRDSSSTVSLSHCKTTGVKRKSRASGDSSPYSGNKDGEGEGEGEREERAAGSEMEGDKQETLHVQGTARGEQDESPVPLVFLCSTLSNEELNEVKQFCELFPFAVVHDSYSPAVTHVIVRADRKGKGKNQVRILKNRTMKYLQGVLGELSLS